MLTRTRWANTFEQGDNVTQNLRSGLLGGLISSVIWMIISTAVGMGKGPVIIGGLAFLIGTWLITTAISTVIARRASSASAH
jgi:riboflavin transporter FmnP